jgi:hypothetical protein
VEEQKKQRTIPKNIETKDIKHGYLIEMTSNLIDDGNIHISATTCDA